MGRLLRGTGGVDEWAHRLVREQHVKKELVRGVLNQVGNCGRTKKGGMTKRKYRGAERVARDPAEACRWGLHLGDVPPLQTLDVTLTWKGDKVVEEQVGGNDGQRPD